MPALNCERLLKRVFISSSLLIFFGEEKYQPAEINAATELVSELTGQNWHGGGSDIASEPRKGNPKAPVRCVSGP